MYQRILVPIDGSATANRALAAAIELAKVFDSRLRLAFVLEASFYVSGYDMYGDSGDLVKVLRDAGQRILDDGLRLARVAGVEADSTLCDKFADRLGEAVAAAARSWDADLVVVGTHGRRGIGRVLMGSGAEQILRLSPVPVLVIRAEGQPPLPPAA